MTETTYDMVVQAEAYMYAFIAVLAFALSVFTMVNAWSKAAEARGRVQYNRFEWEQQRQEMLRTDDGNLDKMNKGYPVHEDTAEFFDMDAD